MLSEMNSVFSTDEGKRSLSFLAQHQALDPAVIVCEWPQNVTAKRRKI